MEIYSDKFIKYVYEKEKSLLAFYWSKDTENMPDEKYKELMIKGLGFTKTYRPKYIINNSLEKTYITTIEMQEWAAKNALSKIFENGVQKFAIVESKDFIIKLATEQAVDEDKEKKYGVMFFDNEKKAREWFNKK